MTERSERFARAPRRPLFSAWQDVSRLHLSSKVSERPHSSPGSLGSAAKKCGDRA